MPALQIAGEDDPWLLAQDRACMDMAQRPVVVALGGEFGHRARRIGSMAELSVGRRVEQPNIKESSLRVRVCGGEVLRDVALRETAAMDGDAEVIEHPGLRLVGA